jgi:hypothetical protein
MTAVVFAASSLLVIIAGAWCARWPSVASLDRRARFAIVFAVGCIAAAVLMFLETVLGMSWDRVSLGSPLFFLALAAPPMLWRDARNDVAWTWSDTATLLIIALLTYAVMDARATNGDLIHFWGPKAQQFHLTGKIDTQFLGFQHYYLMHPDYPPLVPLIEAWSSLGAHGFSWWGALLLTPIFVYATVEAFRGLASGAIGPERASRFAMLMAAVLTFAIVQGRAAGGADAPLIMFEAIALAAVTFAGDHWSGIAVAALALGGASWSKFEGAAFAVALIVVFLVIRRRWLAALLLAAPSVILLASWIAFADKHHLLDAYAGNRGAFNVAAIPMVVYEFAKSASYGFFFLPWIAAAAPLLIARRWRPAALPLLVALLVLGYTIFFYLHGPDPWWWIRTSAERVSTTALMCIVVASAAARRETRTQMSS